MSNITVTHRMLERAGGPNEHASRNSLWRWIARRAEQLDARSKRPMTKTEGLRYELDRVQLESVHKTAQRVAPL